MGMPLIYSLSLSNILGCAYLLATNGQIRSQLDDAIASECPFCGDLMIREISLPFILPEEAHEVTSWEIKPQNLGSQKSFSLLVWSITRPVSVWSKFLCSLFGNDFLLSGAVIMIAQSVYNFHSCVEIWEVWNAFEGGNIRGLCGDWEVWNAFAALVYEWMRVKFDKKWSTFLSYYCNYLFYSLTINEVILST